MAAKKADEKIVINGTEYVRADLMKTVEVEKEKIIEKMILPVVNTEGLEYVAVRTYGGGVHTGYLKERNGTDVTLINSTRVWYWEGACSLNEFATKGPSLPEKCKFSLEVPKIILTEAVEIVGMSEYAKKIIDDSERWEYKTMK